MSKPYHREAQIVAIGGISVPSDAAILKVRTGTTSRNGKDVTPGQPNWRINSRTMDDGGLRGPGMGAAVCQEQPQSAQNQQNGAKAQADALPGTVTGNSKFVLHLRLHVNFRGPNAAKGARVAFWNRKNFYAHLRHNK